MDVRTLIQLVQDGRHDEAEALFKTLVSKAKLAPDKFVADAEGSALFYRGGKRVILDEEGNWKLAQDRKERRR